VSPEQLAITEAKILKQKQTIIDAAALLSESVDTARTDLENILDTAIDKEFSSPDDPDASLKMRSVESISDSVRDRLSGIRTSISNQITLSEQATEADLKYKYILDATRKTQSLISEMRALLNPKTDFQENAIDTKLELSKSQSESLIATLISPSSAYNSAVNDLAVLEGELVAQESGASIEDKNLQSSVIKSKQAEVNALYSDLSKYRISSPISGEVFQTFVDPFQNVSPTQSVISVIDRNPFVIRANVAESDVVFVGIGNPVDVTFDAITDSTYQAQVTFVESQIDTLRSVPTYETTFVFNEGQDLAKIKSGMTANMYMGVRAIKRTGFISKLFIIFIMMLTFLNLLVVRGVLVGIPDSSLENARSDDTGDVLVSRLDGKQEIEKTYEITQYLDTSPYVRSYSVRYTSGVTIESDYQRSKKDATNASKRNATALGINPVDEQAVTGVEKFITEGRMIRPGETGSVLIGQGLLDDATTANFTGEDLLQNVSVGGKVLMTINNQTKEYRVIGIVSSKGQVDNRVWAYWGIYFCNYYFYYYFCKCCCS